MLLCDSTLGGGTLSLQALSSRELGDVESKTASLCSNDGPNSVDSVDASKSKKEFCREKCKYKWQRA